MPSFAEANTEISVANVTLNNFVVGKKISEVELVCEHPEQYEVFSFTIQEKVGAPVLPSNMVLKEK